MNMLWNRPKTASPAPPSAPLAGVDLNSSRVGAVTVTNVVAKVIALAGFEAELPLTVSLETRRVGPVACRKAPHLVCSNFLSQLGVPREWRGPKLTLTPESALLATFEALRPSVDQFALTLPGYLTHTQVASVRKLATESKLTVTGSANCALAIAAHRAEMFLAARPVTEKPDWVVPLHPNEAGPGIVLVIETDETALSATAILVDERETKILSSSAWPTLSGKLWKDRLLDAVADRCVRLCRRDPRDSAEAEQGLFDQLDHALTQSRKGADVTLSARADRWYQDLPLTPAEFETFCVALVKQAVQNVRDLVTALPMPPKAVWLTSASALLPGLAASLYDHSLEGTDVAVLPSEAAAEAAAALDARIRNGLLSAEHHDAMLPANRIIKDVATVHSLSS